MVSNALSTYVAYGTAAAMPATPSTGTGVSALYFQTDTGLLFAWNGSAMVQAGGTSPAEVLISEVVTAGSQASVTFSAIPATYRDLIVRTRGRSNNASALDPLGLQFNGDTGTNYDFGNYDAEGSGGGGGSSGGGATGQTSANFGYLTGASTTAGFTSFTELKIGDYRGTTFHKSGRGIGAANAGTTATQYMSNQFIAWRSTAAINAIKIFPTGTFVNGSVVSLYGSL